MRNASNSKILYVAIVVVLGDRTFKLPSSTTSEPGRYVKSLRGARDGDANDTGTNPALPDTDGDGFDDGVEVAMGTDPTDPFDSHAPPIPVLGLGPIARGGLLAGALLAASRLGLRRQRS